MSTTAKPREKIGPKIKPRPTAASAARAARNASNRSSTLPALPRQSPTRGPPSPATSKIKTSIVRSGTNKSESKTDIIINRNCVDYIPQDSLVRKTLESYDNMEQECVLILENAENKSQFEAISNDEHGLHDSETFETINSNETHSIDTDAPIKEEELKLSRPQTPKSASSRPQTPRTPSRPNTPAQGPIRHGTPVSRPNTPQPHPTPTRPRTPATTVSRPVTPKTFCNPQPSPVVEEYEDLKASYLDKQKLFHRMKKELDLKQQAILEVFDGLRNIRERMTTEGISAGGEGLQELVVFNIADWAAEEIAQLCRDAVDSSISDGVGDIFNTAIPIDECLLTEVEKKAQNVPACFANLCLQAFTARQELIDWVKDLVDKNEISNNDVLERISRYNSQGLEMCETLREIKSRADNVVDTITALTKRVCRERTTLIAVGESLVREIAHLRENLETKVEIIKEINERHDPEEEKALEDMRRELEEERAAKATIKDKLSSTESQLRQARIRVTKMDKQLREAEASISSLTGTVKSLEDQNRQREALLEGRARKLKESLKTGELASNQISQQRDTLLYEVNDLKVQIQALTEKHKSEILELNNKIKELTCSISEEEQTIIQERLAKKGLETELRQREIHIEELNTKITELELSRPNPDLPTEREMDLWAELHATKDTLRVTEEEVTLCKREKIRFLETLTKIAESENKMGLQQKLAAELLSKEEVMGKMQIQIRELTKNMKLNEQKVVQYEKYVRDLQAHNRAVANCHEAPNGIRYEDLQQEIMTLKMSLMDSVHRNEELSELLAQKEQLLEQQDKTSRAQARVIKVREELINMLKNKETEQSRELTALQQDLEHRMKIVDEVNKQIAAKADEIQELFTTLENKQQQIHRLEKIVLALEEQQRRAQAQRTRHEEKIAALEHELAAGINRKERKYFFF